MAKEKQKDNMDLYEKFRKVPSEALKNFDNGKFKGTDVNPMWRIKILTEVFGPCGQGWYFGKPEFTTETDGNIKTVHCTVSIYWKLEDGTWSAPVYGVGGNTIANVRRDGNISVTDEAYKMAFTDACGIAAKQLGVAADVWFEKDTTKYTQYQQPKQSQQQSQQSAGSSSTNVQQQKSQQQQCMLSDEDKAKAAHRYLQYNEVTRKHCEKNNLPMSEVFDKLVEAKKLDAIGNIIDEKILAIINKQASSSNITDATIIVMDEQLLLAQSNITIKSEVKAVCQFFNSPSNSNHIKFYENMIGHPLGDCIPNECHLLYVTLKSNNLIA